MAETEHRNYPLPEPEHDVAADVYLLRQALQLVDGDIHALLLAISGLAPTAHTHEISGVNGLTAALAGKAASNHAHGLDDLTDVQSAGATPGSILYMGPSSQWIVGDPASVLGAHQHTIANVEGLQAALDGKLVSSALPGVLAGYTTKAAPVDADTFLGFDSAASNAPKRFSWLAIKNTLKTWLDTLYSAAGHTHDDRYFTEGEADSRFANVSGDTFSGDVDFNGLTRFNGVQRVRGEGNRLRFGDGNYAAHYDGGTQIGFLGSDGGWRLRVNNNGQLIISGNLLQFAGSQYATHFDGSQIGFLGASGQWLARVNNSGDMTLSGGKLNLEGSNYGIRRVGGEVYITGSDGGVRLAIRDNGTLWSPAYGEFEDRFVSPNDDATFSNLTISGAGPSLQFSDTDNDDWLIHINSNLMYFRPSSTADFNTIRFHPDGNIRLKRLAEMGHPEFIADAIVNAWQTGANANNNANGRLPYDVGHGGLGGYVVRDSATYAPGTLVAGSAIGESGTWRAQGWSWRDEGSPRKQLYNRIG